MTDFIQDIKDILFKKEYAYIELLRKDLAEEMNNCVEYEKKIKELETAISRQMGMISDSKQEIERLEAELDKLNENPLEEKLNSKYTKKPVKYTCRYINGKAYDLDVRNFFVNPNIDELKRIVKDFTGTDEDKAYDCFKWIRSNIKYEYDSQTYGVNEHWDYPHEVLELGKADCEGQSILLANLMIACGIPYYKVRLVCGWATRTDGTKAGHCYLVMYIESKDRWVALDTTFYPKTTRPENREDYKKSKIYGGEDSIWWSFSSRYCFQE